MPSNSHRMKIAEDLRLLKETVALSPSLDNNYKMALAAAIQERRVLPKICDSIDEETLAVVAMYCEMKGLDVILGEIPEMIHKLHVGNSLTRLQLSSLLDVAAKEMVYNKKILPWTPWNVAHRVFPEYLTKPSDIYMAQVVDWVVERGYKRPLVLQGGIQAMSTPEYLLKRENLQGLKEILTPPQWRVSIAEDYFLEELIEKFSILDVMQHGPRLMEDFDRTSFKSTYSAMEKYMEESIDSKARGELRYIHARLLKKYFDQMGEKMDSAETELRRLFLSQT